MFNSPILDVSIGLVFIFLLYSLLATSINELFATIFGLRARMLKTAIAERMLVNNPQDNRWMAVYRGTKDFFSEILKIIIGSWDKEEKDKKIGDKIYDHPIIKNYGSSRLYPLPSYISSKNFSTVLIDVLKNEFEYKRVDEIAKYKFDSSPDSDSLENIKQNLLQSSDSVKIKELIDYYGRHYAHVDSADDMIPLSQIDKDTWRILSLLMQQGFYSMEKFSQNIEQWFDDTMNRVSGWYKRQTQIILLLIGLFLSVIFNIDTLQITHKLSVDKDARNKLVQLAIDATDKYKDDPRVKKIVYNNGTSVPDTTKAAVLNNDSIFQKYQMQRDSINQFLKTDLKNANDILALGWDDYGMRRDSAQIISRCIHNNPNCANIDTSNHKMCSEVLATMYDDHWIRYKVFYVLNESRRGKKFLGFLITAIAISLGAPFWFDTLNKLVKLRASGKKEDTDSTGLSKSSNAQQPINIQINTKTNDEAVG